MLEFQQNEPQNLQKIVTLMNNKVAAVPITMELPGDTVISGRLPAQQITRSGLFLS